ncbi:uncharacterized protein VP01_3687g1 [Puccinia sorghi]|uniref:Uncharacterized protein n=1 Tax=Puccinia sorghi TaxID=27349 RepID=A0A0L6UU98_9BASI|nr:uncharacterized protein VP01_3687g1 [Puccinia sorghi]
MSNSSNATQKEAKKLPMDSPQYCNLQGEVTQIERKIHELSAMRKLSMQIFQDGNFVCSTISGSRHNYLLSVELASLIVPYYDATQCILVVCTYLDCLSLHLPFVCMKCLPKMKMCTSSFKIPCDYQQCSLRLPVVWGMTTVLFNIACTLPSKNFPACNFTNQDCLTAWSCQPRLLHHSDSLFPTYSFFHLLVSFAYRVGFIMGHAAKVGEIWQQLQAKFPPKTVEVINFNCLDDFKGGQNENNAGGGIWFLKDIFQMNAALTQAKLSNFIMDFVEYLVISEGNQAIQIKYCCFT